MSKSVSEERREIWLKILKFLNNSEALRHSSEVGKEVGLGTDIAYYRLKSLAVEGLVRMERTSYGAKLWGITDAGRKWLKENS